MSPCRVSLPRERSRRPRRRGRGPQRTLEGNKAHGRIGRCSICNGRGTSRTRRWSKALKSGTPPKTTGSATTPMSSKPIVKATREGRLARVQRRSAPTSVGGGGSSGDRSASLPNGPPGRSGLRSRSATSIRSTQVTSHPSLDAEDDRFTPVEPPRWSESWSEAPDIWFAPDRRVVVVTWGSASVDRSITIMDRALRWSRRHRTRCQPASAGRDDASWLTSVSWHLSSFGSWETPAALLREDGDGIASTLCESQRVAAIACIRVSACPTNRPGGGERARVAEATETLPVLGRDCSGSRVGGAGIRVDRVEQGRPKG